MPEAPWPAGPVDAVLDWENHHGPMYEGIGTLWFLSPATEGWHANRRCPILVSRTCGPDGTERNGQNVWQVTVNGDGTATVSPSIHFIGHFHSPKPVVFRLVEQLADP